MRYTNLFFLILMAGVFSAGCSNFAKIQKSDNIVLKAQTGIEYYKKKNYYKASVLLDEVVPLMKGRAEAEDAQYYQAFTYYDDKQYVLSAYHFKEFCETYPRSPHVEECAFLYAKSLYKDSPNFDLDQTNTIEAIQAFQAFANKYPTSKYLFEANKTTDDLNKKLEVKDYENAKLFYRIGNYKSAIVAFSNFLEKYPVGDFSEEITFLKIEAQYNLAKVSVEGPKKRTRFLEAIEFYHDFIDKYPSSRFKKSAESIYDYCNRQVTREGQTG
jgi:outer membrane protein assembly factor BamD